MQSVVGRGVEQNFGRNDSRNHCVLSSWGTAAVVDDTGQ